MDASKKDCCKHKSDCDSLMTERMHYFMGRHLTACDFTDEQTYHRSHRILHNRMLHGWGVVCGLNVRQHPQPECRDSYVEVSPGIALDCCGQELIVECCASCIAQKLAKIPGRTTRNSIHFSCSVFLPKNQKSIPYRSSTTKAIAAKRKPIMVAMTRDGNSVGTGCQRQS